MGRQKKRPTDAFSKGLKPPVETHPQTSAKAYHQKRKENKSYLFKKKCPSLYSPAQSVFMSGVEVDVPARFFFHVLKESYTPHLG
jgi:hypothetical protein